MGKLKKSLVGNSSEFGGVNTVEPGTLTGNHNGVTVNDAGGASHVSHRNGRECGKDYSEGKAQHWGMIAEKSPARVGLRSLTEKHCQKRGSFLNFEVEKWRFHLVNMAADANSALQLCGFENVGGDRK